MKKAYTFKDIAQNVLNILETNISNETAHIRITIKTIWTARKKMM